MNPYILSTLAPYFNYLKTILTNNQKFSVKILQMNNMFLNAVTTDLISHLGSLHKGLTYGCVDLETVTVRLGDYCMSHKFQIRLRGDVHRYCILNQIKHNIRTYPQAIHITIHSDLKMAMTEYCWPKQRSRDLPLAITCPQCYYVSRHPHKNGWRCVYCQHQNEKNGRCIYGLRCTVCWIERPIRKPNGFELFD